MSREQLRLFLCCALGMGGGLAIDCMVLGAPELSALCANTASWAPPEAILFHLRLFPIMHLGMAVGICALALARLESAGFCLTHGGVTLLGMMGFSELLHRLSELLSVPWSTAAMAVSMMGGMAVSTVLFVIPLSEEK